MIFLTQYTMSDYSGVDFSRDRRDTSLSLSPTDIDDITTHILKPLKDAGFVFINDNEKFVKRVRNDIWDFEYTNGIDKRIFETIALNVNWEEDDPRHKLFDDITRKGVDSYIAVLKKRDLQKKKLEKRQIVSNVLKSSDTPFKQLPVGLTAKMTNYLVGGKRRRKSTRRRKTRGRK